MVSDECLSPSVCLLYLADHGQVWDVAFEPGKPDVVATCGGKFICVFNLETSALLRKYEHMETQDFYSISWSSLDFGNILASGSNEGEIRLYDMDRAVNFSRWTCRKRVAINAVQFHSEEACWLFTASKVRAFIPSAPTRVSYQDGVICLWDIGHPSPPTYSQVQHTALLKLNFAGSDKDIYSMAWVGDSGAGWIMVGTMDGLLGWRISSDSVKAHSSPRPHMVEFR